MRKRDKEIIWRILGKEFKKYISNSKNFYFYFPFQRSVSENSLVAMDFSGQIGRVIENPAEAQCAALEEGYTWRVRELFLKNNLATSTS